MRGVGKFVAKGMPLPLPLLFPHTHIGVIVFFYKKFFSIKFEYI
jgi:hypothetical protein